MNPEAKATNDARPESHDAEIPEDQRAPRLRWASKTHVGRFRKINQDAYLMFGCNTREFVIFPNAGDYELSHSDAIFAVSDGMGGEKLGHRASKLALSKLSDIIPRHLQKQAEGSQINHCEILNEALHEAHAAINHEARFYDECEGMGATLTICWFTRTSLHLAHVGDSRAYLYASSKLRQISHDHTLVGQMQRKGGLTEMQARSHPKRHCLTQAVGARSGTITPQLLSASHAPGDLYILCSDGFSDGLWDKQIAKGLQGYRDSSGCSLEDTRDTMLQRSLEEGGRDNITVIMIEFVS